MSPQPPPPNPPPPSDPRPGRSDGPAWPGPPSTWPGGAEGVEGWEAGTGGAPDGPPPPPWRRRRRRWLIALAVVGALVVIGVPVGFGLAALSSAARDIDLTTDPGSSTAPADPGPREEVEIDVPDLDGLEGTDAELGQVLVDVHRAEDQMLATQERFAEILGEAAGAEPQPDAVDEVLDDLATAAGEGQQELQAIRQDLTATTVEDDDVREIRDRYLAHLDAWVRFFVAVEEEPSLVVSGGDEAFMLAINTTADAFARTVREGLPDGLDEEVEAYAEDIVDRGFPGRELSSDDTV